MTASGRSCGRPVVRFAFDVLLDVVSWYDSMAARLVRVPSGRTNLTGTSDACRQTMKNSDLLFLSALLVVMPAVSARAADSMGGMPAMDHAHTGQEMSMPDMSGAASHRAAVSQRGGIVMPFSLDRTRHVFHKDAQGGVQQVLAREADDEVQVTLIRKHLRDIRARFLHGDFSDPAYIHGKTMPGLAELNAAGSGAVGIDYQDIPQGAQLAFRTRDPKLIDAIHRWFDAQVHDHGRDAESR